jgi:hypothetical protein
VFDFKADAYSSLSTEKPYSLDIREFKEKGKELVTAIEQAVKDTQSAVVRAYPDNLIMTQAQYNNLTGRNVLWSTPVEGQEFYLYRTKYNIMEVEVK